MMLEIYDNVHDELKVKDRLLQKEKGRVRSSFATRLKYIFKGKIFGYTLSCRPEYFSLLRKASVPLLWRHCGKKTMYFYLNRPFFTV